MLAFDFLLHAGLLARLYLEPTPFLLPPRRAFALIPLGYLSFLVLAGFVLWLCARLGVADWRAGARLGLTVGFVLYAAWMLGLLSITTAPPGLLLAWLVGESVKLGVAGAVVGGGLAGGRLGRLGVAVLVFAIACVAATVILQSTGLAPAVRMN